MIYNVRQCQTTVRKMSDELQTTVKHVLNNYKTKFIILIFFANDIQCQTMSNKCQTSVKQLQNKFIILIFFANDIQCQTMSNNCQKDVRRASDNCQTSVKQLQNKFIILIFFANDIN